jgi:phosphoribosylformylglycinamidine synthase subunit PurSL
MTATPLPDVAEPAAARVHRVEVHPAPGQPDPLADQFADEVRQTFGPAARLRTARVYLIEAPLDRHALERIADELLADPINQRAVIGADELPEHGATVEVHYLPGVMDPVAQSTREAIVEMLAADAGLSVDDVQVRTGFRYDVLGLDAPPEAAVESLQRFAELALANPVIQAIHDQPFHPERFPQAGAYEFRLVHVPIRGLDDEGLQKLSRQGHLFLSLEEMRAIHAYYQNLPGADRDPTDIELETLGQTWSEHCVHKTLKATIRYRESEKDKTEGGKRKAEGGEGNAESGAAAAHSDDPSASRFPLSAFLQSLSSREGHTLNDDGSVTIHNLLKSTVAAATRKLMEQDPFREWCVSVFVDNAGIVRFDDEDAVCIKVETHNHPSAIEPYGGAATGIGGCIRDVMGTGLSAKPIANTDVFCVAPADASQLPKGVLHPRRVLRQVVAGVRDYGNRMGIPTVNGAVWFDEDYLANPLVFCGCVGLIPLDKCFGDAQPGDRIIALGGRTGRDGIHGATFSSAELTDTHADEFAHAVQIGNAITQKKVMDVILQARDPLNDDGTPGTPLFHAVTDCGAGGFSSAVGEMGAKIGARVDLENAPLKYAGLSYTEVWISEAQERMVLAVPRENVDALRSLCEAEGVEMCDLGQFGWQSDDQSEPVLVLNYRGQEVGRLSMHFLHDGVPMPTREATWNHKAATVGRAPDSATVGRAPASQEQLHRSATDGRGFMSSCLHALLTHPNIASKHWIIRQYDHEVQGGSVVKPLVGPHQDGPGDAAVLRPKLTSDRGIALACGMAPNLSEKATQRGHASDGDSYWATLAAIDEAVRNAVCVGADPSQIAILDNFCWPRCDDPAQLGSLVRAAEACYDGALAYRTPFVSGKDSLSNQFTTEDGRLITIAPTMLITALGIVPDVTKARTMDAKSAGNLLIVVGDTTDAMGGSHAVKSGVTDQDAHRVAVGPQGHFDLSIPRVDLKQGPINAAAVARLIDEGVAASAHDCSDGGLLVAAAEMAFAGRVGLDLDLAGLPTGAHLEPLVACFAETPSRYLLEIRPEKLDRALRLLRDAGVPFGQIGTFADHDRLTLRTPRDGRLLDEALDDLLAAWREPLDW